MDAGGDEKQGILFTWPKNAAFEPYNVIVVILNVSLFDLL